MKTLATLVLGMCVLAASTSTPAQPELVLGKIEIGAAQNSTPCFSKKISGKISPFPRMKCRIS